MIIRYGSDDMESDLREAFKIFDRDKDGFVDISEFKQVDFYSLSPSSLSKTNTKM